MYPLSGYTPVVPLRPDPPITPPPRLDADAPAGKPRTTQVRFMPTTTPPAGATPPPRAPALPVVVADAPRVVPTVAPTVWEPTPKQERFKETATREAAAGNMTFPAWRMSHRVRCEEMVTAKEWQAWNADTAFVEWFTEDIVWPVSEVDKQVMDSRYHVALEGKLKTGSDTKALELYAKQRKFIGDDASGQNSNVLVLLNWAKGHGATAIPQVIDTTAVPLDDEDPWGGARVK